MISALVLPPTQGNARHEISVRRVEGVTEAAGVTKIRKQHWNIFSSIVFSVLE